MKLERGQLVRFKTRGFEIADVRNRNPPTEWQGHVNGEVVRNEMVAGGGYVPLWCKRENREPTNIFVALADIIEAPQ